MDVKSYLGRNYRFLGRSNKVKLLNKGINSTNWFVSAGKKKYVLRKFTDGSSHEKMEKMCRILDFCKKHGAKVVKPIKRKDGLYIDKRAKLYLTEYYKGEPYHGKSSELKDAAKNLAILHSVLASSKLKYPYQLNQRYYRHLNKGEFNRIEGKIRSKKRQDEFDKKALKSLSYLRKRFQENEYFFNNQNRLLSEKQLIHFDFQPGNVIFNKGKVAVILDLASMRTGSKIEDLGFAAFRFALVNPKGIPGIKRDIKVFLKTYLMYNSIEEKQLEFLKDCFLGLILGRISYILKKRYFSLSDSWSIDFNKILKILKLSEKVEG
ncbi:MAG: phosphotransferase [Candidatus Nealsonbacteria bacterium]|nr:phosphotransferase [Candidatus Nealsonbacteria bacterium]